MRGAHLPNKVASLGVELFRKLVGGLPGSDIIAKPQNDFLKLFQLGKNLGEKRHKTSGTL